MASKISLALSLAIALCLCPVAQASQADAAYQAAMARGRQALDARDLARAEAAFRLALSLSRKSKSNQKPDVDATITCLNKLAGVLALRQKCAQARRLYVEQLDLIESSYGKDSPRMVPALIGLGSLQESEGNPQLAMPFYKRAFAINERHYGTFSPEVVSGLRGLGRAAFAGGDKRSAHEHLHQAMRILLDKPGLSSSHEMESLLKDYRDLIVRMDGTDADSDLLAAFKTDMAKLQAMSPDAMANDIEGRHFNASGSSKLSQYEQARGYDKGQFKRTQDDFETGVLSRDLGLPSVDVVLSPAYDVVNTTIFDQGRFAQSADFYMRKIAIDTKALGDKHPGLANDLVGLALYYINDGKYPNAIPLLRKAMSIYDGVYGADNLMTLRTRANLALALNATDQRQEALALAKANVYGFEQQLHNAAPLLKKEYSRAINQYAFLLSQDGRYQESIETYARALPVCESVNGADSQLTIACIKDYIKVLRMDGQARSLALAADLDKRLANISAQAQPPLDATLTLD